MLFFEQSRSVRVGPCFIAREVWQIFGVLGTMAEATAAAAAAAPTSSGDDLGGTHCFQKGVWLTKGRGERVDKFHKWAEDHIKNEVERLDKEEHESLVKLNGQRLQVRTELRGLKKERRLIQHQRQNSSSSSIADGTTDAATSPTSPSPPLHKSSSTGSLASHSSGYSSLSSATSGGRRVEGDKGEEGSVTRGGLAQKNRTGRDVSVKKVKVSARALSKLKNKMEVYS
ncbi:hypothetical protein ACOMHN_004238 [Nucella lapillus]